MAAQPVQWILVIFYGSSAHRATYGRLDGDAGNNKYTKDYIQLSRKPEFLQILNSLFPGTIGKNRTEITYNWPLGTTNGALDFSSDRWHLKWETRLGAPRAWRMLPQPSEHTAETIPGDPSHQDSNLAENEFNLIFSRCAGQPYLVAVKLYDQPDQLHIRVYLQNATEDYSWADLQFAPAIIQELAASTSKNKHTSWSPIINSGGVFPTDAVKNSLFQILDSQERREVVDRLDSETRRSIVHYLKNPGHGLFFDPNRNHDSWLVPFSLTEPIASIASELTELLEAHYQAHLGEDAAAESMEVDIAEVENFRQEIENERYGVPDVVATVKTRGSAQKAFADKVKSNYGYRCAVTGISTKEFLVASHIVPWSADHSIRLDPSNGICLSLLIDRAFENGYLLIDDDFTIRISWPKVGRDTNLENWLKPYEHSTLQLPRKGRPKIEYLQRRRMMFEFG
jgi:hypothetical protein